MRICWADPSKFFGYLEQEKGGRCSLPFTFVRLLLRQPVQRGIRVAARFVFCAQGRFPTQGFDDIEDMPIGDFTVIGRATVWDTGKLNMANDGQQRFDPV